MGPQAYTAAGRLDDVGQDGGHHSARARRPVVGGHRERIDALVEPLP